MSDHDFPADDLLAAVDRVASVPIDPATFPESPSLEFREAAVELLNQIARARFAMDGGDLDDLDEIDVEDTTFFFDLADLNEFVEGFQAEKDQARYSACRAVAEWATAKWKPEAN